MICLTALPITKAYSQPLILLDDCLQMQFAEDANLQSDAYRIGHCYLTLASQHHADAKIRGGAENAGYPYQIGNGFSGITYLQYADSWFQLAEHFEHPLAKESRERVTILLNVLNREYLTQR